MSKYKAYFVTANEYPLYNVLATNTTSKEIKVFSLVGSRLMYSFLATAFVILGILGFV